MDDHHRCNADEGPTSGSAYRKAAGAERRGEEENQEEHHWWMFEHKGSGVRVPHCPRCFHLDPAESAGPDVQRSSV